MIGNIALIPLYWGHPLLSPTKDTAGAFAYMLIITGVHAISQQKYCMFYLNYLWLYSL